MEKILEQQKSVAKNIANFIVNTNKSGKDKQTEGFLRTRLELLKIYWDKYQSVHDTLLAQATPADLKHEYFTDDHYATVEIAYSENCGVLIDLLNPSTQLDNSSTCNTSMTAFTLPKIQLSRFGGELKEWPAFHDLFKSLIDSNNELTGSQKLYYLKTSLFGQAHQLVRNIAITDSNYTAAWQLLCSRYQNERLLVSSSLSLLTSLEAMRNESAEELRKLYDGTVEAVKSLESLKRPVQHWDDWLIFITVQKLDPSTRRDWENSLSSDSNLPTHEELCSFLKHRVTTLEVVGVSSGSQKEHIKPTPTKFLTKPHPVKVHFVAKSGKCPKCNGKHILLFCPSFRQQTILQRRDFVSKEHLCYNCLRPNHSVKNCPSVNRCQYCNQLHHSMLHTQHAPDAGSWSQAVGTGPTPQSRAAETEGGTPPISASPSTRSVKSGRSTESVTALASNIIRRPDIILLATAKVRIEAPCGRTVEVKALLDQGSQATFVSSFVASYLRLPHLKVNIPIKGIGASHGGVVKSMVSLRIRSLQDPTCSHEASALVLPKLAKVAVPKQIKPSELPHLCDLQLADPDFGSSNTIDLIIGADIYHSIILEGIRKGTPTAQKTTLGWVLSGPVPSPSSHESAHVHCFRTTTDNYADQLDLLLQKFWELEDIPSTSPTSLSEDDQACENFYRETTRREPDGRYVVRLPIRVAYQDATIFGDSKRSAIRYLQLMERRFSSDPIFKNRYMEFMKDYHQLSHMELIPPEENNSQTASVFYLPHHGILKESSLSTKLRVVFNGSCKSKGGLALNDYLAVGPKLQSDLCAIVLRWRMHLIVLAADIRMMYRQIRVDKKDCDLQRIVWRESALDPLKEFRLLTVTYGTTCAPYLAIRTLLRLAEDEAYRYPLGAKLLRTNFYVDDVLFGADNVISAYQAQCELQKILQAGGFQLHKWASNSDEILQRLNPNSSQTNLNLNNDAVVKTLGLVWNRNSDCFGFQVTLSEPPSIVTKRNLLSDVAKLYDPLGFLTPTLIIAKAMFQKLWLLRLDWDTPLPDNIARDWLKFRNDLVNLEDISISRWIGYHPEALSYEIHGFSDASETAYAAVAYFRATHDFNNTQISLICSKTKLAPIKKLSIPRLELMGAHLLARLIKNIQSSMDLGSTPIYCWSDSQIVLTWLKAHPAKWKTFVANRVSQIHELIPTVKWRHVPTSCNPADCASRGIPAIQLATYDLWWNGPAWLKFPSTSWPQSLTQCPQIPKAHLEEKSLPISAVPATISEVKPSQWELLVRYSSLNKLLRVTAWCQRFVFNVKAARVNRRSGELSVSELNKARMFWIHLDQQSSLPTEYKQLSRGLPISHRSPILRLSPFFDKDTSTIRVGGRLQASDLPNEAKHQYILTKDSTLSALIIAEAHNETLHGGVQLLLNFIRQRFWILGARELVRKFSRRCIVCFRQRAAAHSQLMGTLPAERVRPGRAFLFTGLDYAGPILVRYGPGRGRAAHKAYIALFVCMATKAIHIELVSDLTTDAFIAAYKRFTARRGHCRKVFSDNGTTFVGADKILRESLTCLHNQLPNELHHLLSSHGTEWHFIPPNAPNFGGLWEAGVKAVKSHLKRVIGTSTLTFEELYTLLTQIEACVNSRPLFPLSSDPDDHEALTPGHFLMFSAPLTQPEPSLELVQSNRLSRWKLIHQMYEHFWRRWSKDYLNNLQERTKWTRMQKNLTAGLLVLIRDDRLPPATWALGRILEVHPGSDGLVRVVTVLTNGHTLKRPINKLCALPISDAIDDPVQAVPSGRAVYATEAASETSFRQIDEAGGDVQAQPHADGQRHAQQ